VIRVVIADDELPARQRLRQLLSLQSRFEVIGEAESGAEAMELVETQRPDLLLLDIHMPQGTGLDVAACLPTPRPAIIFCTAYDQHAVDAFELNALDYLLKPVSRARLEKALSKIPSLSGTDADTALNQLLERREQRLSRFLVKNGSRYQVIPAEEISYIEAVDGLTRLVTKANKEYWLDPPLNELETRLNDRQFFRVSRKAIVNVDQVDSVQTFPGGSGMALTRSTGELEVSRRRLRDLLRLLEGKESTHDNPIDC